MTFLGKINIIEDLTIGPPLSSTPIITGLSFEERVLRELKELKNDQKKADEKRVLFEAFIETKLDNFVKVVSKNQRQSRNDYEEPDLTEEIDDFEDLDEDFPIKIEADVMDLNWNIQGDLGFKRRMVNKIFTCCSRVKFFCVIFNVISSAPITSASLFISKVKST